MAFSNPRTPPSLQLFLLLLHLLSILIPLASPLSFNHSGADLNIPNMRYQGDAFFDGDIVQLTKVQAHANLKRSSGRMVYPEPVTIYDEASVINFTSCFSFFIYGFKRPVSADGLAFFLSSYPSEIPDLSCGGTLGLFTSPDGIITYPSIVVAVEFDTFINPQYNDISANHMGIDVHTINSTVQLDLKTSIRRNTTFNACVDYKATTKNLSVFLSNASDPTINWSLSYVVDLRKVLPAKVAVGFTAATGVSHSPLYSFSFHVFSRSTCYFHQNHNPSLSSLPSQNIMSCEDYSQFSSSFMQFMICWIEKHVLSVQGSVRGLIMWVGCFVVVYETTFRQQR
ncbi:seed lectin beta chain-like [Elaeis guineensis]|uniref:seed lectin beta chain-like n=1 Tax=Elaeis guineensis var. tenera TaxID=51953 RepID=UPI003C6CE91A